MSRLSQTGTLTAMTTTIVVLGVGITETHHRRAMEAVTAEAAVWEERFSRFRTDSMLSRVNATPGQWIAVDEVFLHLLEASREAVIATDGRFDPAILPALEARGYDRTLADVQRAVRSTLATPVSVRGVEAWTHVEVDRRGNRVRLPAGMRVDFGGIAKGALADRLARRFRHWPGGAISIGGDMCLWGDPPTGDAWMVGIEHPLEPQSDIARVALGGAGHIAMATSSQTKRAWHTDQGAAHHLIDPLTWMPAASPLLAVSVCSDTAVEAEIVAKNLMVASAHGPLASHLLLKARWALAVSDSLNLTRIAREAA